MLFLKVEPLAPTQYDIVVLNIFEFLECEPERLAVVDGVTHLVLVTGNHIAWVEALDGEWELVGPAVDDKSVDAWGVILNL